MIRLKRIKCEICGHYYKSLSMHLRRAHKMSKEKYTKTFGFKGQFISSKTTELHSKAQSISIRKRIKEGTDPFYLFRKNKKNFNKGLNNPWAGHNWGKCRKCGKFHKSSGYKFIGKTLEERLGSKKKADEWRINISRANTGRKFPKDKYPNFGNRNKKHSLESKKKRKEKWQDPIFKNKQLKAMLKNRQKHPNVPEMYLDNLIQPDFPSIWKINTKRDTIINGHFPDWINCNGQKKCININGLWWHLWKKQRDRKDYTLTKKDIEKEEKKPYEELGFKLLIIWEDELENPDKVIIKIKNFTKLRN